MSGQTRLKSNDLSLPTPSGWTTLAHFITNLTSPPFLAIPTYIILAFYDQQHRGEAAANVGLSLTVTIFFGVIFPVAFILALRRNNKISGVQIPIRQERTIPFLGTIGGYLLGTLFNYFVAGGSALTAIMGCYCLNAIVVMLINFGWKISVHATGVGGPLAALTILYGWAMLPFYLLIPLVGWARVQLKAHTLLQVIAGTFFGLLFTLAQLLLIYRPLGWF